LWAHTCAKSRSCDLANCAPSLACTEMRSWGGGQGVRGREEHAGEEGRARENETPR
jgi:hypothetical protein